MKTKYYTNCNGTKNYYPLKGDTIIFRCDSIHLLNRTAYRTLEDSYERLHTTSSQVVTKIDSAGLIYKNLYEDKSRDYDLLNATFSDFRQKTENHIFPRIPM